MGPFFLFFQGQGEASKSLSSLRGAGNRRAKLAAVQPRIDTLSQLLNMRAS